MFRPQIGQRSLGLAAYRLLPGRDNDLHRHKLRSPRGRHLWFFNAGMMRFYQVAADRTTMPGLMAGRTAAPRILDLPLRCRGREGRTTLGTISAPGQDEAVSTLAFASLDCEQLVLLASPVGLHSDIEARVSLCSDHDGLFDR